MTWGSRGSARANKVAFQRIATAPNVRVYLAVVSIEAIGNSVPRNDTILKLPIDTFIVFTTYYHFATTSLDLEGRVVGVAVSANRL